MPIPLSGVASSQSFGSLGRFGVRSKLVTDDDVCDTSLLSTCFGRLFK